MQVSVGAPSVVTVVEPQPLVLSIGDSGSAVSKLTVTCVVYQPPLPFG